MAKKNTQIILPEEIESLRGEITFRHFAVSSVSYIISFELKIFVIKLNLLVPVLPYAKCTCTARKCFFFRSSCVSSPVLVFVVLLVCTAWGAFFSSLLLSVLFDVCYARSFKIRQPANLHAFHSQNFWFDILFSCHRISKLGLGSMHNFGLVQAIPLTAATYTLMSVTYLRVFTTFERGMQPERNKRKIKWNKIKWIERVGM